MTISLIFLNAGTQSASLSCEASIHSVFSMHKRLITKEITGNKGVSWALLGCLLLVVSFMFRQNRRTSSSIRSLVVLPLENLSDDVSQDYFADGMTDALITDGANQSVVRDFSHVSDVVQTGAQAASRDCSRIECGRDC